MRRYENRAECYFKDIKGRTPDRFTIIAEIAPPPPVQQTVIFRDGERDYAGTRDTYLREHTPDRPAGDLSSINVDADDPPDSDEQVHALLRFDDIFGSGPGQIPPGSTIVSATLTLTTTDPGADATFHRMLSDWNEERSTWSSMVGGVDDDDVEATESEDLRTGPVAVGARDFGVTASVQAWSDGGANRGWALLPHGGNG
jgi:hypothetical protein